MSIERETRGAERSAPTRTCIGCRAQAEAAALVRVVLTPESPPRVVPDVRRALPGRGASLHPRRECFERAGKKGAFGRALAEGVAVDALRLADEAAAAYRRRAEGLLVSAQRAREAVCGTDTVRDALREGRVALLVVAGDAEGRAGELEAAVARLGGRAVRFADKARLGDLFGRAEVAVAAIVEHPSRPSAGPSRFADAIREAAARASALSEVQ